MNNKLILIVASAIVAVSAVAYVYSICRNSTDELVSTNVEALSRTESGFRGYCYNSTNDCLFVCPNSSCRAVSYGPDKKGPSYGMTGTCARCGHSI